MKKEKQNKIASLGLSDCCQSEVKVAGGMPDFEGETTTGQTFHYECTLCQQPCGLYTGRIIIDDVSKKITKKQYRFLDSRIKAEKKADAKITSKTTTSSEEKWEKGFKKMIEAFVIEFHSEGEYPLSEVYWLEKEIRQLLQSDRAEMIKKILPEKKINFGR